MPLAVASLMLTVLPAITAHLMSVFSAFLSPGAAKATADSVSAAPAISITFFIWSCLLGNEGKVNCTSNSTSYRPDYITTICRQSTTVITTQLTQSSMG